MSESPGSGFGGSGDAGFAPPEGGFAPPVSDAPPTQAALPVQPPYQPNPQQPPYPQPPYSQPAYPQQTFPQPPYPQAYPGGYYGPPMMRQQNSGMAVAGMMLGICSLVLFWASLLGPLLAVMGIIFSSLGMSQTSRPGFTGRGMAIAGLVCSLIAAAFWVLLALLVASILA